MKINYKFMLEKYSLSFIMFLYNFILINFSNPHFNKPVIILIDIVIVLLCIYIMKQFGKNRPFKNQRQIYELITTISMFLCAFIVIFSQDIASSFTIAMKLQFVIFMYLLILIILDKNIRKGS